MKKSNYSPDAFMHGLYTEMLSDPYGNVTGKETALKISEEIKSKTKAMLGIDKIPCK